MGFGVWGLEFRILGFLRFREVLEFDVLGHFVVLRFWQGGFKILACRVPGAPWLHCLP